jgi:hypothetical protein
VGLEALTRQVDVTIILSDLPAVELLRGTVTAWSLFPITGVRPELVDRLRRAWAPYRDHSAGIRWTDASAENGQDVRRALERAAALLEPR